MNRADLADRVTLERDMRRVLAELELTSCGTTSTVNLAITDAPPTDRAQARSTPHYSSAPPRNGDPNPPHLLFRDLWRRAHDDDERRRLLDQAQAKLDAIRRAPPPPRDQREETTAERDQRILLDGHGWRAEDVALAFRMTPTAVRRVRTHHGRDPERGELDTTRRLDAGVSIEARQQHARALRDTYGLSTRQLAPILGVSPAQAALDLRATAVRAPLAA